VKLLNDGFLVEQGNHDVDGWILGDLFRRVLARSNWLVKRQADR
jgi:hypothetical protein